MRSVVQYEIYFLSKEGRWNLHGRYPAAERQDAIKDAMMAEGSTGLPTKVIRDTYFPDTNAAETVTIYTSPKLKALSKSSTPPPPLIKPPRKLSARSPSGTAPQRPRGNPIGELVADFMTRAVLAACLSTVAAALVTGMISWLLSRMNDFGTPLSPAVTASIISFVSIGMFVLGFVAFFRLGARFKSLIRKLWTTSSVDAVADQAVEIAKYMRFSPKDVRPKNPSRAEAELERATQEVKRQRGDPDVQPTSAEPAAPAPAYVAAATTAADSSATTGNAATEQDRQESIFDAPGAAPASASVEARPADQNAAKERTTGTPAERAGNDGLALERLLVSRFVIERVLPLTADHAEDPITRRGLAFLMTGAVSHLAVVSKLDQHAQDSLLSHALTQCRLPESAIAAFKQHRADPSSEAGWHLQDAGRAGMLSYLEGATDTQALADAWRAWRVPVRLVQKQDDANSFDRPREIYLITELRDAADTNVMEFHNRIVRASLEETGGVEIKHTGKGILARFEDANAAVAAALAIADSDTTEFGDNAGWFAVAMVPGFSPADDPMLSPRVTQVAATFLETLAVGEIACDRAVLAAASRGLPPGFFANHEEQAHIVIRRQGVTPVAMANGHPG